MRKRLHAKKYVIANFAVLLCFITVLANKMPKFVNILEQSLSQTRLCAIFISS